MYRYEQFFEIDGTAEDAKVKLAAIHLEGRALQWHQIFMKSRLTRAIPSWEEYISALSARYGSDLFDDPMAELKGLRQIGSVLEYQDKFDALLNRVELLEEYAMSCFISGLKDEIQIPIKMFQPRTLQRALSLAKLQEVAIEGHSKNHKGGTRVTTGNPPLLPTPKPFNNQNYSQNFRALGHSERLQYQQNLLGILLVLNLMNEELRGCAFGARIDILWPSV